MSSDQNSTSNRPASPARKHSTSSISGMLTHSEIESLRQDANEKIAYARKAFAHLRPVAPSSEPNRKLS